MKLTIPEAKTVLMGLRRAIEYEKEFAEIHRVEYKKRGKGKTVPSELMPMYRQAQRNINRFQKLGRRLLERMKCKKNPNEP
jgi:hypothetical protein